MSSELDLTAVKQRQQATWATGDFGMVAWLTTLPAENRCDLIASVERFNRSGDDTVLIENAYLEAVGTRL